MIDEYFCDANFFERHTCMLLPIKPEYANLILAQQKKYEYRKFLPRQKKHEDSQTFIFMYVTAPIKMIKAIIRVPGYIDGTPEEVWNETKSFSGVSKEAFDKYFQGRSKAYAMLLGERFQINDSLENFGISRPPQSHMYITSEHFRHYQNSYLRKIAKMI